MIIAMIKELKKGKVKNVIRYGSKLPAPPYLVVKPEHAPNGRNVRFIAHFQQGMQDDLEDYLRYVIKTMTEYRGLSRHGCTNQLGTLIETVDIGVISDDDTISMEALFLMPTLTF